MAAPTIDVAFVSQFETEVHIAYQRMGSMLRNTGRTKTGVKNETTFQKVGKGVAGTKARHGQVPIMNLDHTNVKVTLTDYYAGEMIDKLDELRIQHDERGVVTQSISAAMGRKTDEIIRDSAFASITNETTATGGVTKAKVQEIREYFGENDVANDGKRYLSVAPAGWSDLMDINEFVNRDYIPESDMPWAGGMVAKRWNTFFVFEYSGWSKDGSNIRSAYAWHPTCYGHAIGQETSLDITWQGKEQAHLVVASLQQGAVLIDGTGGYRLRTTES